MDRGIYSTVEARDFEKIVRERLAETGETAIGAARRAGLPRDAIRSVLRGHPPNLLRAKKICDALGLDLNVGSPHESATRGDVHPSDAGRLPRTVSQDLERHTQGWYGLLRLPAAIPSHPKCGRRSVTELEVGATRAKCRRARPSRGKRSP